MTDSPHGKNIVVFDLEIKNVIDGKLITWKDYAKMGISVGVAHHYLTGDTHIFTDENIEELPLLLNQADIVSGFNILGFDNSLLNATTTEKFTNIAACYDLLEESRRATGWRPTMPFPKGMRLDDHLLATFGPEWVKTEDGAQAPVMYQRGELNRLIDYCIADVERECMLFDRVWAEDIVRTATHGDTVLRHPLRPRRG